LVNILR
jgi:hypothetical protein